MLTLASFPLVLRVLPDIISLYPLALHSAIIVSREALIAFTTSGLVLRLFSMAGAFSQQTLDILPG